MAAGERRKEPRYVVDAVNLIAGDESWPLIDRAELYVVLGFEPPAPNWNEYIRQFDTFHVRELDDQLFD
jgi:hypothetical protein